MPRKQPDYATSLFCWDNHQRSDRALHEEILADGDDDAARDVSREVMDQLGFTEEEIALVLPESARSDESLTEKVRGKRGWMGGEWD